VQGCLCTAPFGAPSRRLCGETGPRFRRFPAVSELLAGGPNASGRAPVPPECEDYVRPRPRAPCSLTFRSGPECADGSSPPPSASRLLHHRDVSRRRPQPSKARWNMILDCGQCMEDLFLKERMLCCSHIAHVIGLRPSRGLTLVVCSKRLSWLRPSRVPSAGTKRPSKCPRMPVSFSMTARVAVSV
jgi:hypothetical protein